MTKATHNGTCQCCGRLQAVRPKTGHIANHGYTTDHGYFNGTCSGSGEKPLEVSAEVLDQTASDMTDIAELALQQRASDIREVRATYGHGSYVGRTCVREYLTLTEENLAEQKAANSASEWWAFRDWSSITETTLRERHGRARSMLSHVKMLRDLRQSRHGEPLIMRMS